MIMWIMWCMPNKKNGPKMNFQHPTSRVPTSSAPRSIRERQWTLRDTSKHFVTLRDTSSRCAPRDPRTPRGNSASSSRVSERHDAFRCRYCRWRDTAIRRPWRLRRRRLCLDMLTWPAICEWLDANDANGSSCKSIQGPNASYLRCLPRFMLIQYGNIWKPNKMMEILKTPKGLVNTYIDTL